jgi:hypothetical protein
MIIIDKIYTERWKAELELGILRQTTIAGCDCLAKAAESLGLKPQDMYEVIEVGERQWKINATAAHLAATQKFYKIV